MAPRLGAVPASANAIIDGNRPQHIESIAHRTSTPTSPDHNGFTASIEGVCTIALTYASIADQSCEHGVDDNLPLCACKGEYCGAMVAMSLGSRRLL